MPNSDRVAADVRRNFVVQAEACNALGSSFTSSLCRTFAEHLDHKCSVGALCLNWQGDPSPSADSVPLRLCGGLHALVLSGRDEELAAQYPPNAAEAPCWEIIRPVLVRHETFLLDWMKSPPQTNEVARASVLWASLYALTAYVDVPLRLFEVGASAGLNLNLDRFSYGLGGIDVGDQTSPLRLCPKWSGVELRGNDPKIIGATGCDINPLNPANEFDALRLRSYVWPDQTKRLQRLDAAISIAGKHPKKVENADALDWIDKHLSAQELGVGKVLYSTIAWQYLPERARELGTELVENIAENATKDAPLFWLRFEADGKAPGAGIRLQIWPLDIDCLVGRADFHGRWIEWAGLPPL